MKMPSREKKGITVKIDAELHNQIRQYLEEHNMTMAEFVAQAADNELHPKNQMKEGETMANTRTIAFQVPEELFQRIKDYLQRNNMTQRQFLISLIEEELDREMTERKSETEEVDENLDEDTEVESSAEDTEYDQAVDIEDEGEAEDEEQGFSMSM